MNHKGFTLIELLAVVAILAIASGLIATRFLGLIDDNKKFEDEVIAKTIAEAAYVFVDSEDNLDNDGNLIVEQEDDCRNVEILLDKGYIPDNQGLLDKCNSKCLKEFSFIYTKEDQKKVKVYKNSNCTGEALYTY